MWFVLQMHIVHVSHHIDGSHRADFPIITLSCVLACLTSSQEIKTINENYHLKQTYPINSVAIKYSQTKIQNFKSLLK